MKYIGWKIYALLAVWWVGHFAVNRDWEDTYVVLFIVAIFTIIFASAFLHHIKKGNEMNFSRRSSTAARWSGVGALVVAMIIGFATVKPTSSSASAEATNAPQISQPDTATPEPDPTPEPTEKPLSRLEQKRDFLRTVDESISGARIAGNPYKFVGTNVDLHCQVTSIPEATFVNAECPADGYGGGPNIVVETDSSDLETGQRIRVIGTVLDPMEGTNAMGGTLHFPTVKAEFME